MKVTAATFFTALALYFLNNGWPAWRGWGDVVALCLFGLMMLWLLRERRGSSDPEGHEKPREGVAFRFGKLLNRVRRGFRRAA